MHPVIIENIDIAPAGLLEAMDAGFLNTPSMLSTLKAMADALVDTMRPIAIYGMEPIMSLEGDRVYLEASCLNGPILTENLKQVDRIFPFIVSCGEEADRWISSYSDYTETILAHELVHRSLYLIMDRLAVQIRKAFNISTISIMNPGSLPGWDISEQDIILEMLSPVPGQRGISISEKHIISPAISLSGIIYESEEEFLNCMLCSREDCPLRRRPFDGELHSLKYGK